MGKYTFPATYDEETAEFICKAIKDGFRPFFDLEMIGLDFDIKDLKISNAIYEYNEFKVTVKTNDKISDSLLESYIASIVVNNFYDLFLKYHGREQNG